VIQRHHSHKVRQQPLWSAIRINSLYERPFSNANCNSVIRTAEVIPAVSSAAGLATAKRSSVKQKKIIFGDSTTLQYQMQVTQVHARYLNDYYRDLNGTVHVPCAVPRVSAGRYLWWVWAPRERVSATWARSERWGRSVLCDLCEPCRAGKAWRSVATAAPLPAAAAAAAEAAVNVCAQRQ